MDAGSGEGEGEKVRQRFRNEDLVCRLLREIQLDGFPPQLLAGQHRDFGRVIADAVVGWAGPATG